MAVELATAYVSIAASAKGIQQSIASELSGAENAAQKSGEESGRRYGSGMSSAVKGLALIGGLAAVTSGITASVGAASDLAETVSKSRTVFGPAAAEIEKWASNSATAFGQSRQQAIDAASTFGNLFVQLDIGADQAAGMSTAMVELASDFASFHNADPTQVIEAQTAAFRGEYDALQRFVPTISAATVEQKALAMTGKATTKELTAQEKALAVQALMMEGAGDAAGDFARTSEGMANQQRIAAAQMADLAAQAGNVLLPILTKVLSFVVGTVIPGIRALAGFVADNKVELLAAAAGIATLLIPAFIAWAAAAIPAAAATVVATLPLIALGVVVGGLAFLIVKHFDTIKRVILDAWKWVQDTTRSTWDWIQQMFARFWPALLVIMTGGIAAIPLLIIRNWDTITRVTSETIAAVVGFFRDMPGRAVAAIQEAVAALVGAGRWVVDRIREGITGAAGAVFGFFLTLPGEIIDRVMAGAGRLLQLGKDLVEKIVDGIKAAPGKLGDAISGLFKGIKLPALDLPFIGDGPGRPVAGGSTLAKVQQIIAGTGASISSTYRDPARNRRAGGSPTSYHMDRNNPAVDIVAPSAAILDMIAARLRAAGPWRELLWRVPNHAPGDNMHIHVAHKGETVGPYSPGWAPGLAADERLRAVQVGEVIIPKGAVGAGARGGVTIGQIVAPEPQADAIARSFDRWYWMQGAGV